MVQDATNGPSPTCSEDEDRIQGEIQRGRPKQNEQWRLRVEETLGETKRKKKNAKERARERGLEDVTSKAKSVAFGASSLPPHRLGT